MEIEKYADVFKLLGDKNRLMILTLLREKELCVCEIVEILQTSQPNISQHMRKLKDAGFVQEEKRGQWVYYSLHVDSNSFMTDILKYLPSQKEKLDSIICKDNICS